MNYRLVAALNAYNADNYVPFDETTMPHNIDAERMLIMKDSFEKKLSPEAQLTINLILTDMKDVTVKRSGISWTQVKAFLKSNTNFNCRKIDKIRMEVKIWLHETV
jgi:hypothetical protein